MSEGKARNLMEEKMTPEQQAAAQKAFAKQESTRIAAYKKQLREGNDLKKLQVEELELNNRYFHAKKEWMEVQPELQEIEAREQAILQKERSDREKLINEQRKEAEKKAAEKKPEIVIPKQETVKEG
jgi:hypothetical protein